MPACIWAQIGWKREGNVAPAALLLSISPLLNSPVARLYLSLGRPLLASALLLQLNEVDTGQQRITGRCHCVLMPESIWLHSTQLCKSSGYKLASAELIRLMTRCLDNAVVMGFSRMKPQAGIKLIIQKCEIVFLSSYLWKSCDDPPRYMSQKTTNFLYVLGCVYTTMVLVAIENAVSQFTARHNIQHGSNNCGYNVMFAVHRWHKTHDVRRCAARISDGG